MAVTARVMPSLSRPSGVRACTRDIAVTIVGAVAMPASRRAQARAGSEPVAAAAQGRVMRTARTHTQAFSERARRVP